MTPQSLLAPRTYVRLPADHPPVLVVVVDTEEEFLWGGGFRRENTSVRAMAGIPRVQALLEEYGIRPTYVIDYPVATQPDGYGALREFHAAGKAVIGAHLHPWVNPPFEEEPCDRASYACNLGADLEARKLRALTDAIEATMGERPVIYKAGRYGVGPATTEILEDLGYEIDLSIAPRMDLRLDGGGPDFMAIRPEPYWFGERRRLLEIPVTAEFVGGLARWGAFFRRLADSPAGRRLRLQGLLGRTGALHRLRISPEGMDTAQHLRLTRALLRRGVRVFTFSFHSPSVSPGYTPYVRTPADLERMLGRFRRYFDHFFGELHGVALDPAALAARLARTEPTVEAVRR